MCRPSGMLSIGMWFREGSLLEADDELATISSRTVTSEGDGDLIQAPLSPSVQTGLTYNARNQLTSIAALGSSYSYGVEGQRLTKTVAGQTTTFVNNPLGNSATTLIETTAGVTRYYIYGIGLIAHQEGNDHKTYHFDHIGNTVALTSGDGTSITDRFEYSPYGAESYRLGNTKTPFRFNGMLGVYTDSESGLIHMRARYYSPYLKRFINSDPIGFAGGMNHYAFAASNPLSFTDPTGLGPQGALSAGRNVGRMVGSHLYSAIRTTLIVSFDVIGRLNLLGNMADYMRSTMIQQSRLDTGGPDGSSRNIGYPSVGHRSGGLYRLLLGLGYGGDGIKIGGGRFNSESSGRSPLGWHQGGQGGLFAFPYKPGAFGDYIVESFSGVHDYLNSGIFYDRATGNIRDNIHPTVSIVGEFANAFNVLVATPFVISSLTFPTNNTFP